MQVFHRMHGICACIGQTIRMHSTERVPAVAENDGRYVHMNFLRDIEVDHGGCKTGSCFDHDRLYGVLRIQ